MCCWYDFYTSTILVRFLPVPLILMQVHPSCCAVSVGLYKNESLHPISGINNKNLLEGHFTVSWNSTLYLFFMLWNVGLSSNFLFHANHFSKFKKLKMYTF